ncbi:hypothetical protein PSACC_02123 [Paramicrosporidium saccamoebae]|uniref:Uncharacterized protein n=1 Tax=Paramicrosporidium saccamoebae TaxID=1246581 RepID=A0A2H9TJX0_9FUNG|nr:hypothetical protein PSACC_02123 [Paramicrosporidium saccamoebae]
MRLVWLRLIITCSAICIKLSQNIIETKLDGALLHVVYWSSLQYKDNYPAMGQMLSSFGLGQTKILTDTCSKWTRNIYQMVREFVVANPKYEQYFLTPECAQLLKVLTIQDTVDNLRDGLYASAPPDCNMENEFALKLALLNIDCIDRFGLFRSRLVTRILDWSFLPTDDMLSNVPVSGYLSHHMVENFGNELTFVKFLCGNLERHQNNVENYLVILEITIERLAALRHHTELEIQEARLFYDAILKYSPNIPYEVLIKTTKITAYIRRTAPNMTLSGVFTSTDPIHLVKLGILVHGIQRVVPPSSLVSATRKHLKAASDFEFVELLRLITEYGTAGSCRLYTNNLYKRLHDIRPQLTKVKPTVMGCFTAEERIAYFRRWESILPWKRHWIIGSAGFDLTWAHYLFRVPIYRNSLGHVKRLFHQCLEHLRKYVIVFSTNYGLVERHWLSLNDPPEDMCNDVIRLFTLLLLSKLHYDGIGYELEYRLAYEVACQPKSQFTRNLDILSSGIMVVYNLIC